MGDDSEAAAKPGRIAWVDLTTGMADELRGFYGRVAGWSSTGHDMGGYDDYVMQHGDGTAVAGICHARGQNAGLPAQWLIYITVPDLDAALQECVSGGGKIVREPGAPKGENRYAVIEDPAGAVCALYETGKNST